MIFDVSKLTLDEVGIEIDRTLDTLERLQKLYEAMLAQDHRRIEKFVKEYKAAKRKAEDGSGNPTGV